jgi:hypothetical protein
MYIPRPYFGLAAEDAYHAKRNQDRIDRERREEKAALNHGIETPEERKARENAETQRTDQRD